MPTPESVKEYNRAQYRKHRAERIKKSMERYYANREEINKHNREYQRNRRRTDPEWAERSRTKRQEYISKNKVYVTIQRAKNNSKVVGTKEQNARRCLGEAIKRGKVIRPCRCDYCKAECKPEAHHFMGYDDPYKVVWLCELCHKQAHWIP